MAMVSSRTMADAEEMIAMTMMVRSIRVQPKFVEMALTMIATGKSMKAVMEVVVVAVRWEFVMPTVRMEAPHALPMWIAAVLV